MSWLIDSCSHPYDIHVIPLDDLRPHEPARSCWCRPCEGEVEDYGAVVLHTAMDLRELYTPEGGSIPLH